MLILTLIVLWLIVDRGLSFSLNRYDSDELPNQVFFRVYGSSTDDYEDIFFRDYLRILEHRYFNHDRQTVFYFHGYTESGENPSFKTVMTAYTSAPTKRNVVGVDWSHYAGPPYLTNAIPNARNVSTNIATALRNLINNGLLLKNLHMVGHSLGAHISGLIGHSLEANNITLPRVTGLDPANPGFYPTINGRLDHRSARFVDIVITDSGRYGAPIGTGHAAFWVNGGKNQPGCPSFVAQPNSFCDHERAWEVWAESVLYPNNFPSTNYKNNTAYLGPLVNQETTQGDYYLTTNSESPYGKGILE